MKQPWIGWTTPPPAANPLAALAAIDTALDLGGVAEFEGQPAPPDPAFIGHLQALGYLAEGVTAPDPTALKAACSSLADERPNATSSDPNDPDFRDWVARLTTFEPLPFPLPAQPLPQGARGLIVRVAALQLSRLGLYHGPIQDTLDESLYLAFCLFRHLLGLPHLDRAVSRETLTLLGDPYQCGARFFDQTKPNGDAPGGRCLVVPSGRPPEGLNHTPATLAFSRIDGGGGGFASAPTPLPAGDDDGLKNRFGLALLQVHLWIAGNYQRGLDASFGSASLAALRLWLQELSVDQATVIRWWNGRLWLAPRCFALFGFERPTEEEVAAHENQLSALGMQEAQAVALAEDPGAPTPTAGTTSWLGRTWNAAKNLARRTYASVRAGLVHAGRAVARGALVAWRGLTGPWQTALRCFTALRRTIEESMRVFWRRLRTTAQLVSGQPIATGTGQNFVATWWQGAGDVVNLVQGERDNQGRLEHEQAVDKAFSTAALAFKLLGAAVQALVRTSTGNFIGLALSVFRAWRTYRGRNTMTPVWVR